MEKRKPTNWEHTGLTNVEIQNVITAPPHVKGTSIQKTRQRWHSEGWLEQEICTLMDGMQPDKGTKEDTVGIPKTI